MKDYDKRIFATNLKYYLMRTNMTQADLAQKLNVTRGAVSSWCNGLKTPRIDAIEKMTFIFGCQKSDLIEKPDFENLPPYISPKRRLLLEAVERATDEQVDKLLQLVNIVLDLPTE